MVAFADASFILSLYLLEAGHARALQIARQSGATFPLTPLLLLEIRNALNLRVQRGELDQPERNGLWQTFQADITEGIFVFKPVPVSENYRLAGELSDRYTPQFGTRTLDLLHVAAAKLLETNEFFTFDQKQAKAARAEGLKVRS
jgi:predicted nucleic acid-binding protein